MIKSTKKTKRDKKAEEVKKHEVYLLYEESTHGGAKCVGDKNAKWPNYEDQFNEFYPKGLRLKAPDWSETIEVDFDPAGSEHLYVVVVRYSSGNTFGKSHGHWHIEGAYKSYDEAEKIEIAISKGTGKYNRSKNGLYGKDRADMPWVGYFERLEGVTVERLDIWK